MSQQAKRN